MTEFQIITDGENILKMQMQIFKNLDTRLISEHLHSYFCTPVHLEQKQNRYIIHTKKICKMPLGAEELKKDRAGIECALKHVNDFHVTWKIDIRAKEILEVKKRVFEMREEISNSILKKRKKLMKLYTSLAKTGKCQREQVQNEIDLMILFLNNNQKQQKGIKSAIERIAQNTFGICTICQEEIPTERLKLIPITPFCIDCCKLLI